MRQSVLPAAAAALATAAVNMATADLHPHTAVRGVGKAMVPALQVDHPHILLRPRYRRMEIVEAPRDIRVWARSMVTAAGNHPYCPLIIWICC